MCAQNGEKNTRTTVFYILLRGVSLSVDFETSVPSLYDMIYALRSIVALLSHWEGRGKGARKHYPSRELEVSKTRTQSSRKIKVSKILINRAGAYV